MIADKLQAQDDMFGMFMTGWGSASWTPIDDTAPEIRYDGRDKESPPPVDHSYVRIKVQHADGGQTGFALGNTGQRKYSRNGIITVQSFGSDGEGRGLEIATYMAIIAERVFQGKTSPNGVWFRRVRSSEVGTTAGHYQFNTFIDFEYYEVR